MGQIRKQVFGDSTAGNAKYNVLGSNKTDIMRGLLIIYLMMLLLRADAQSNNYTTSATVKDGVIYSDNGIPETPRWFADSRLAFSFDETGISQVDYYSPDASQNLPTFFLKQLWDGFRYFIEKDKQTYKPAYVNCAIWPFGISAEWRFNKQVFKHNVFAIDESIIFQITTPDTLDEALNFKMEFYEAFGLSKGSDDDMRYTNNVFSRNWDAWFFNKTSQTLEGKCTSIPKQSTGNKYKGFETCIIIGGDFEIEHIIRPINTKHILKSPAMQAGRTYSFIISLGNNKQVLLEKHKQLADSLSVYIEKQFSRYKAVAEKSPQLISSYTDLSNFISLAPMYHESLKIIDVPGAIRAKTSNYWVWGWDGMTSNDATAYWGDTAHLRNMLWFYKNTANPESGIGHAFEYDMNLSSISSLPAQGMYISLLHLYLANTTDTQTIKSLYPFARQIFNSIAATEVAGTGLCKGISLFPDFPEALHETGNDISGFNNTVFYCAARSMESLAAITGDDDQQSKTKAIIQRFEKNFIPLFFDRENNFIVSSVDATSLTKRNVYNSNAIRWENNYCADLTKSIDSSALIFFRQHAVTPMGLREIPLSSSSYDMDANQLHSGWPATGEYFIRLINSSNQRDLVEQWIKWVSYWTKHLSCPEGISNYIETDAPEFDRWTSQKGTWQGYSIRGWYQAALHGVVGVGTDIGGITFYPYSGEEMELKGLNYLGKKFDISMKGSGSYIASIVVDGDTLKGTAKLPVEMYRDKQNIFITINRTSTNQLSLVIESGNAIQIEKYSWQQNKIVATVTGSGVCRLELKAKTKPTVKLAGKKINTIYNGATKTAIVQIDMQPKTLYKLEIFD